jgi:cytochrome c551/c552
MPFNHADPTSHIAKRLARRSMPWTLAAVAALAAAIGWCSADAPRARVEARLPTQREAPGLPVLPLVLVIAAVAVAVVAWLTTEAWLAASRSDAVARALTGGDPTKASVAMMRYGCGGCHTIPGLSAAEGKVGPPLEGIRQRVFIAGSLPNTADNLINWIVTPRLYRWNSAMPATGISKAEARDVAAWLYAH